MASTQISSTIDPHILEELKKMAEKNQRSLSWTINHLLTQAVLAEKMKKG